MSKTKGSSIAWLRSHMEKAKKTEIFLKYLDENEAKIFRASLPLSWLPLQTVNTIFEKAAQLLHPNDPDGLQKIGFEHGQDSISGLYKMIFHIISMKTFTQEWIKGWKIYHDTGTVRAEVDEEHKKVVAILENHPDYPRSFALELAGFFEYGLSLMGIKKSYITYDDSDPNSRKWTISW